MRLSGRWPVPLLVLSVLLSACNRQTQTTSGATPSPKDAETGRPPTSAPASGNQIADKFSIPVPQGYKVVNASEHANNATIELSYEGAPRVDDYYQQMKSKTWELTSPEPVNSFKWKGDLLNLAMPYVAVLYLQTQIVRILLFKDERDRDAAYETLG